MAEKPAASSSPVRGAGGVVFNARGDVLLLHHIGGDWVFPKGHIDAGESVLGAALREVEEEAGVRATCPDETATRTTRYTNPRGQARLITWFPLLTEATKPTLRERLFPEGGFFAPDEALRRLSFEEDRALLREMLAQHPSEWRERA